jgi:MFS family permease
VLRFVGAVGMGGEWALGVALVMELWPNASRAWLAGFIGAFGNFGYLICGAIALGLNHVAPAEVANWLASVGIPDNWAGTLAGNHYWRLLMLVGAVPAFLTMFIRLFVPESEKWTREKEAGAASHWSGRDLLGVLVGAATAIGIIGLWSPFASETPMLVRVAGSFAGLVVVILGYLYPARGYLLRSGIPASARRVTLRRMLLAAGISGVPLLGTWAGLMWMYMWVTALPGYDPDAKPWMQISSSVGAAIGCVVGAILCTPFGRRPVYAALCVLSLVSMVGFYNQPEPSYGLMYVLFAGVLGMISASFYGWLPLYLPELFPTAVRATGQGFGFNFGRILAAAGSLQVANLLAAFGGSYAHATAIVAGVYIVGLVLIAIAPETKGKPLPE